MYWHRCRPRMCRQGTASAPVLQWFKSASPPATCQPSKKNQVDVKLHCTPRRPVCKSMQYNHIYHNIWVNAGVHSAGIVYDFKLTAGRCLINRHNIGAIPPMYRYYMALLFDDCLIAVWAPSACTGIIPRAVRLPGYRPACSVSNGGRRRCGIITASHGRHWIPPAPMRQQPRR